MLYIMIQFSFKKGLHSLLLGNLVYLIWFNSKILCSVTSASLLSVQTAPLTQSEVGKHGKSEGFMLSDGTVSRLFNTL